jgi:hypothetical protein
MAKMLGQDLFTQTEFDKFKKEFDELHMVVKLQADEIAKFQLLTKAALALSCLSAILLVIHLIVS